MELTKDNLAIYAAKFYDNPCCRSTDEFYFDLARFSCINKLLFRQQEHGEIRERLVLNHMIVLQNVFPNWPALDAMLRQMIRENFHGILSAYLVFLNRKPIAEADAKTLEHLLRTV